MWHIIRTEILILSSMSVSRWRSAVGQGQSTDPNQMSLRPLEWGGNKACADGPLKGEQFSHHKSADETERSTVENATYGQKSTKIKRAKSQREVSRRTGRNLSEFSQ